MNYQNNNEIKNTSDTFYPIQKYLEKLIISDK